MRFPCPLGELEIINESTHSFGSVDNLRNYPHEWNLAGDYAPISIYGLLLDGEPLAVLGASGGATGVNEHSALVVGTKLYLAICDTVACLRLNPAELLWSRKVDSATCFGIYCQPDQRALYSHGELEIVRFTEDGEFTWSFSGPEIFTNGFELHPTYIEVTDFNGAVFRLDYETGKEIV